MEQLTEKEYCALVALGISFIHGEMRDKELIPPNTLTLECKSPIAPKTGTEPFDLALDLLGYPQDNTKHYLAEFGDKPPSPAVGWWCRSAMFALYFTDYHGKPVEFMKFIQAETKKNRGEP